MNDKALEATARELVASGKGILAADESLGTIGKRFQGLGIEQSETNRRDYRETLFSTAKLGEFISGVILFDETLRQKSASGVAFPEFLRAQGIIPGIKVDKGTKPLPFFPNETITEGLDGLRERFEEYKKMGARFAKWRAVIRIGNGFPTRGCMAANAHALARYAAIAQECGLVPIVEPEVLMDGEHTIGRCEEVTETMLSVVFRELRRLRVALEGMILKPNMVVPGEDCPQQASVEEVADATLRTLKRTVPAAVPGIAFLSGGQSDVLATRHLNAMNRKGPLPWQLSFSYGRALQDAAMKTWHGKKENVAAAQKALLHRAQSNSLARAGKYEDKMN
ncbi:MAG TPA: class I fructose-bisphosphate aldolase [Verrucomicrobiae bacterium]|jgi:fructose-bisphosphate aldolase class I